MLKALSHIIAWYETFGNWLELLNKDGFFIPTPILWQLHQISSVSLYFKRRILRRASRQTNGHSMMTIHLPQLGQGKPGVSIRSHTVFKLEKYTIKSNPSFQQLGFVLLQGHLMDLTSQLTCTCTPCLLYSMSVARHAANNFPMYMAFYC